MKHAVPCFLFMLFVGVAAAQAPSFDVAAYKAFLAENAGLSGEDLLAHYDAGLFRKAVQGRYEDALYADSIALEYALTPDEVALLDRHGFAVTERLQPNSFGDAFTDVYKRDLPVFLSTDAILHALHMSYDLILQEVEHEVLIPKLDALLADLHRQLPALRDEYAGSPTLSPSMNDVDVYLAVARTLLSEDPVAPVWEGNRNVVDDLLSLITNEAAAAYPLFAETCRNIDFSQFTPRGHYTSDPELTRYFQAMIWLGRTEWYLIGPETQECRPTDADVRRQSAAAALLVEAAARGGGDEIVAEIDAVLGMFVGEPDNVTLPHLRAVLAAEAIADAAVLLDEDRWRSFQDELVRQGSAFQRINSQILFSTDITDPDDLRPASAFLLLGQRFVIDAYVTGHVVFNEVVPGPGEPPRMLPSTYDVLFALGNDAAAQFLQDELARYGYADHLAALRYLVDSYEVDFWDGTLYNGWLEAIRTLNPLPATERDGLPPFMQTAAWWQQKMNTQLAAWAQLRHDNLLYAKQSYSGGITCLYPYSYVEPIPAFYDAVGRFARGAAGRLEAVPGAAGRAPAHFRYVAAISDTLGVIARKELAATPLSETEQGFLRRMLREQNICGPQIDGWYPRLFYGGEEQSKEPDLVVADVHTAPTDEFGNRVGWVLHAGTGPLDMAVVTAEVAGVGPVAFVGPVLSYYEHLSTGFTRLTDEEWATAYAADPSFRPAFVDLYLADRRGEARKGGPSLATSVERLDGAEVPSTVHLMPNYPNPFNGETVFGFTVAPSQGYAPLDLSIYDVQGRRIRLLVGETLPPGHYTVRWDGRLDNGTPAASGVYFSRLRIGSHQATGTLTLVR